MSTPRQQPAASAQDAPAPRPASEETGHTSTGATSAGEDAPGAGAPTEADRPEAAAEAVRRAKAALDFADPLSGRSADDSDRGWGERPTPSTASAADLARFLDEKPPHHI
ncbi:hypothetical protein [Streptomyces sp. NPDC007088]|uniref:hypothetical protein n=1 Tax=Streptomyces sp. NPDC007088 TaxID=3364773 RepID=UPI00369B5794